MLASIDGQHQRLGNSERLTYGLYGLVMVSDFRFANRLAPGAGTPDLSFACTSSAPLNVSWEQAELAYAEPPDANGDNGDVLLYRLLGDCWALRYRLADFYLWSDRILCHLKNPEPKNPERYYDLVEILLLGEVLSLWLELRGIPALHASAVAVDGHAAAFLSVHGGGKSSLAATLVKAGHQLLTDDILAVGASDGAYVGRPGYPQMRMWPQQAQHFLGHHDDLPLVHPAYPKRRVPVGQDGFGTFCDVSRPLACLYLPERRAPAEWGTRVEIAPVSRREGLMALVRNSFVVSIVETVGLQPRRLESLAPLVSRVPVRRVTYPDGLEALPGVGDAILEDLAHGF